MSPSKRKLLQSNVTPIRLETSIPKNQKLTITHNKKFSLGYSPPKNLRKVSSPPKLMRVQATESKASSRLYKSPPKKCFIKFN